MFGFTRKKYHYGTTFIIKKNLEKWNQGLPAKFIGCPYCEPEGKIKKKFFNSRQNNIARRARA